MWKEAKDRRGVGEGHMGTRERGRGGGIDRGSKRLNYHLFIRIFPYDNYVNFPHRGRTLMT